VAELPGSEEATANLGEKPLLIRDIPLAVAKPEPVASCAPNAGLAGRQWFVATP